VNPEFGNFSNGSETLLISCSLTSVLHCAASLWRNGAGEVLFHIPVWFLAVEVTLLFTQIMLFWTPNSKHMWRDGGASTSIFRNVCKTGESDYQVHHVSPPVLLPVWNNLATTRRILIKFDILVLFQIMLRKFKSN
jgi:hypothetical protein